MIITREVDEDVERLLERLSEDLQSEELVSLARIPQPRVGTRYRDLLKQLYKNAGVAQATVWVEKLGGVKRVYTFVIRANPEKPVRSFLEAPAVVNGYMIEISDGEAEYLVYRPREYPSAAELFGKIEEFASLYRLSEDRILREKVLEDYYDWL